MYFTIADLERHSVVIRTSRSVKAGDTQIRVRSIPEGIVGEQIIIDCWGDNPETSTVTDQDTKYLTVAAALAYDHAEDVAVVRMWLFDQAIVFNESGADVDFRFEAFGESHALFIQGSDGFVGLGKLPTVRLDVAGAISASGAVTLDDGVGDSPHLQLVGGSNDDAGEIWLSDSVNAGESDLGIRLPGDTSASQLKILNASNALQHYFGATGEVVLNEGGNDADFRVEGENNTHCLNVDAGNDNVNINAAGISLNYDLLLGGDGVLCLKASEIPNDDPNYGKIYWNTNKLYFQDGAGVAHELAYV